jgi:large subunit ribosomal protein L17
MKHLQKSVKKFHRKKGPRAAFIKGLLHNLIMEGSIRTTETRAKAIRPRVERLITIAKKQNVAALRLLLSRVQKESATKLYYEIAPRFMNRAGGYTRITKLSATRKGDSAPQAVIEFLHEKE